MGVELDFNGDIIGKYGNTMRHIHRYIYIAYPLDNNHWIQWGLVIMKFNGMLLINNRDLTIKQNSSCPTSNHRIACWKIPVGKNTSSILAIHHRRPFVLVKWDFPQIVIIPNLLDSIAVQHSISITHIIKQPSQINFIPTYPTRGAMNIAHMLPCGKLRQMVTFWFMGI